MVRKKYPPATPPHVSEDEEEEDEEEQEELQEEEAPNPAQPQPKYPAKPPPPFLQKPGEEIGDIRTWLKSFNIFIQMVEDNNQGIPMPSRVKNNYLCTCIGTEGLRTFSEVPGFADKDRKDHAAFQKLAETHFGATITKFKARFDFFKRQQESNETIRQFETALRVILKDCDFPHGSDGVDDELLMTQLINGTSETHAQKELLATEQLDLGSVLRKLRAQETARKEVTTIKPDTEAAAAMVMVQRRGRGVTRTNSRGQGIRQQPNYANFQLQPCRNCGTIQHRTGDQVCIAQGKSCNQCGRIGHFARMCRQSINRGRGNVRGRGFRQGSQRGRGTRGTRGGAAIGTAVVKIDDAQVARVNLDKKDGIYETFRLSNGTSFTPVRMQVDTGAEVTLVGKDIYQQFIAPLPLKKASRRLKTIDGTIIAVLGMVRTKVQFGGRIHTGDLYVTEGTGVRLMGNDLLQPLKIQIDCGERRVHAVKVEDLKVKFPQLFSETMGTYKGRPHTIRVQNDAIPRAVRLRPIPLARRQAAMEEVKQMDEAGIWEEVAQSEWVHPMVTVPKADGQVRITTDLTALNKHVIPERFPLPRIKDLFLNMAGSHIFSKLDLRKGYFHILLDEKSRELTTTITPLGLRQYTRLPMGLTDSASAFQKRVQQTLTGLDGVEVYIDDVVVHGKTQEEHDRRLYNALSRLQAADFRLQQKKLIFGATSIPAFGHIVSQQGIQPDPKNIAAIQNAPRPTDVKATQRFLGMINFFQDYLQDVASLTEPLRQLVRKDTKFIWTEERELSFQTLKALLVKTTQLQLFDPCAPTFVTTDASDVGIGALLSQIQRGKEVPISFFNKTLTDAERNYAANEKEALACMLSCEHWESFLLGRPFTIRTDHQSLQTLLTHPVSQRQSAKFGRWKERLAAFNYTVEYLKGERNQVADYLSRLKRTAEKVGVTDSNSLIAQVTVERLRKQSKEDPVLNEIQSILGEEQDKRRNAKWDDFKGDPHKEVYRQVRKQLSQDDGLVYKKEKVIVPESLRAEVLKNVHTGHPGITRTKAGIRKAFWWPGIDKAVEELCRSCQACQASEKSNPPRRIPEVSIPRPEEPGVQYALDIAGPYFGGQMIVSLVDYGSRFPEILVTKDTTSRRLIRWLEEVFDRVGNPQGIVTDNGPQFISQEFQKFMESRDIFHYTTSVYNPRENGLVERFNRFLKTGIQAFTAAGTPWERGIRELIHSYRATPQEQGRSPGERFFNREFRPNWMPNLEKPWRRVRNREVGYSYWQGDACYAVGDQVRTLLPQVPKGKSPYSEPKKVSEVLGRYTFRLEDGKIWNARKLRRVPKRKT